jgi:hypothetical protein
MSEEMPDAGYEMPDDSAAQWAGADVPAPTSLSFDPSPEGLGDGGLDVGGLSLPTSLTDPSAGPHSDGLGGMFDPLPPEPHHAHSTLGEKAYEAVTHPAAPAAPPEDPTELERQRQEQISQNAMGQHTPMTPPAHF